jgi:hypothetical protein
VIDRSSSEQASVVFLGRRSFRMEAGTLQSANELAIPRSASDVTTERIFGVDRERVFEAASMLPAARSAFMVSKGPLIGLCLATFACGILVTSTVNRTRSWAASKRAAAVTPVQLTGVVAPILRERVQEAAPVAQASPSPLPSVLPDLEPIVVAAPASVFDSPPAHRALPRAAREARVRSARPAQIKRAAPAIGAAESDSAPAPAAAPAAKKWVDPFAD